MFRERESSGLCYPTTRCSLPGVQLIDIVDCLLPGQTSVPTTVSIIIRIMLTPELSQTQMHKQYCTLILITEYCTVQLSEELEQHLDTVPYCTVYSMLKDF